MSQLLRNIFHMCLCPLVSSAQHHSVFPFLYHPFRQAPHSEAHLSAEAPTLSDCLSPVHAPTGSVAPISESGTGAMIA